MGLTSKELQLIELSKISPNEFDGQKATSILENLFYPIILSRLSFKNVKEIIAQKVRDLFLKLTEMLFVTVWESRLDLPITLSNVYQSSIRQKEVLEHYSDLISLDEEYNLEKDMKIIYPSFNGKPNKFLGKLLKNWNKIYGKFHTNIDTDGNVLIFGHKTLVGMCTMGSIEAIKKALNNKQIEKVILFGPYELLWDCFENKKTQTYDDLINRGINFDCYYLPGYNLPNDPHFHLLDKSFYEPFPIVYSISNIYEYLFIHCLEKNPISFLKLFS